MQRMTGRRSSTTSTVSGGGGDSGVSQAWVEEHYISKVFFNQLFTIHGTRTYVDEETQEEVTEEVVITPNSIADGEEYKMSNVEVSVGLWTQQFLSALGLNPGGGGGGGGATSLGELTDVIINNPKYGQALVYAYDSVTGKGNWVNGNVTPDLTDYATKLWVQQQGYITSSDLNGYATQSWVQQQGYITSSALTGYATELWVQRQGYITSHQSVDGTFWGQSWSNHGSVTGDMTNVGVIFQTGNYTLMNHQGVGLMIEGSAVSGDYCFATFGFHSAGALAWLNNNFIVQLIANTSTGENLVHINHGILQIGDARLVYDSANNALKAVKADGTSLNFYATGGVSALGMSAGVSQMNAMTFNHLSVKNSMTLSGSVNIITGTTSYMVRRANDSDCIYLMNTYAQSKINSRQYYYNQYDNVGLHGTNYDYSETWFIDPDGCARFSRVYLNNNTYIYTNGSDLMLTIGSTRYKLTKTTA